MQVIAFPNKGFFAVGGGLLQGSFARAATIGLEHCPSQGKQALFCIVPVLSICHCVHQA